MRMNAPLTEYGSRTGGSQSAGRTGEESVLGASIWDHLAILNHIIRALDRAMLVPHRGILAQVVQGASNLSRRACKHDLVLLFHF